MSAATSRSPRQRQHWRRAPVAALLVLVALVAAACSSGPPSASGTGHEPSPHGHLTLYSYSTPLGTVVGSIAGVVVYANEHESGHTIVCTTACTTTWKPWLTDGVPVQAAAGVDKSLIGTVQRPGGGVQLTYGGHPLYLYAHRGHPLETAGQGRGGTWYVVSTDGNLVT